MRIKMKRFLGILLTLTLMLGMMPGMSLTVYASTLNSKSTTWSENSDIVDNVTINNNVTVDADITLTIPAGKTLTINGQSDYDSIAVINDNSHTLTVSGGGTLIVNAPAEEEGHHRVPGIHGNLIVDGATVQVTGGAQGVYGNVTVKSGLVCVNGGNGKAGGNAYDGISGVVIVNGGSITVVGGNGGNSDNGDGGSGGDGVTGDVIVNGGSATITGGNGGTKGSDYASNGCFGQAVYGSITGNAEESEDNINWTSVTGSASQRQYIKFVPILVTGVTLDKTTTQTIDVDGKVSFTATVTPENASDKTVKWSVGGTNATAVKLYSDENCTTEVGTDATSTLTVYAKGISAGNATVTCTSNADSEKSASCNVTVNAYAGNPYASLVNTTTSVKFNEMDWYIIADDSTAVDAGTVTLLSKDPIRASKFHESANSVYVYSISLVKDYLDSLTGTGGTFEAVADAIVTVKVKGSDSDSEVDAKLWLLSTSEAEGLSEDVRKCSTAMSYFWWLRSRGLDPNKAARVYCEEGEVSGDGDNAWYEFGVRPALKLNLSSVIFESETNTFSLKPVVTEYPLWVGGTQVTSENASNIDGYNKASYDDSTHTLTLNGYNLTVSNGDSEIEYGIKYTGSAPLTINLEGQNTIEGYWNFNRYRGINYGIYITRDTDDIAADVTFTGEGSLSVKAKRGIVSYTESNSANPVGNITFSGTGEIDVASSVDVDGAICTNYGTVNISGGTLTAAGYTGIEAQKGINISGGTVSVTGTSDSGMSSYNPVSITGGTVTAIGETKGISAGWYGDGDTVTIGANVKTVVISGEEKAVDGKVMNAIAGSAWVNKDGTGNKSEIEASDVPRELSEYKKMVFSSYIPLDTTETNLTPINISIPNSHTVPAVGDVLEASCVATDIVYQWYRGTTLLIGETNSSYTATISDIGKTLKVVVKQTKQANGTEYSSGSEPTLASEETGAVVKKTPATLSVDDAKTNAGISYLTETATPDTGYEVSSSGTANIAITSLTDILNSEGVPVIYVRIAETSDTAAGDWVAVTLTARPIAPTGLTTEKATNGSTANGKISGVDTTMEYSADGTSWTDVTGGTTIEGLTPGTYQVRVKATANVPHGRATEVTVGSKQIILTDSQKPTAKTGLTYTGSEQALIDAPTVALPEGATEMRYAIGTDATTAPNDGWNASIPTGTEVKTYYVWYKAVGDEDHSDSKPACITVTISKPAEAPAPADEEKGKADFKPSAAVPDVKGVEQEAIKSQMEELAKADDTKLKAGQVKDVTVNMETKAVAESDVPKKEASAIKETAEGMIPAKDRESTKCDFLDIAVSKIVIVYDVKNGQKVKNESNSTKLTNLAQVIDIPVKYDLSGKFNPLIVRYHNGKAEAFRRLYAAPAKDALKDGTYYVEGTGKNAIVHIYTNRFSTYALLTSGTEEYPRLEDSVTVYRLYYGPTMEHFYTTSAYERRVLIDKYGWVDEGIAWKSPKAPTTEEEKKTIKPVYRLFNPFTTDHHYTKDPNERKTLINKYGWKDEGVAFYSNDKGDATVYRLWHPGLITGAHHFTTGKHEYDVLITRGWIGETEAFKVNAAS